MKKWAAMLMALVMMLVSAGTVMAETAASADLYDLYDATETGKNWIGTAVPVMDGVAVASPVGLPEKVTMLEIWDGTAYRTVSVALPVADGKVLVLLHETDGAKPAIPAYDFLNTGIMLQTGDLMVRSGDWMRSRVNRAVYDVSLISWNGKEAMLLTLSGDTVIGSPVVTMDGKLAGIIMAEYAEGMNRYVALTVPEISNCLQEAAGFLDAQETDNRPEGYQVSMEGNMVTFDWSGVSLPEVKQGEKLYHIVADSESSYLNYLEVDEHTTSTTMLLTPGRTYLSGLSAFAGTPDDLPTQIAVTAVPEAEKLTDYEFKSLILAIAEMPEGATGTSMPVPTTRVTEELLRSGRACMLSSTSYQVNKKMDGFSLLVALTAPDGSNYRYESQWYYDPEIMGEDEWYVSMTDTGLLDMLNQNGYPDGIYEMAMYIDGKLADSFSFELIK